MATAFTLAPAEIRDGLENMAQSGLPTHRTIRHLDVGTRGYLEYLETEVFEDLIGRGGATCRFFEGAYGAGKTHLLRLIAETGLDQGMAVAWTDLSQALSLEDWRSIVQHVLQNLEVRLGNETVRSFPSILQALRRSGQANVAALRAARLPHAGFHRAMLYAVETDGFDDDAWLRLRNFLLGQKVLVTDLRRNGIHGVKDPLTVRNAEQALASVLAGLYHLGLPGTLLLFDENERTLAAGRESIPTKVKVAANLMRRLIDGCTTGGLVGAMIGFAVLNNFLTECARVYPALGQRLRMPRGENQTPAWRWPVLPVGAVSSAPGPDEFAELAIERLVQIVQDCGGQTTGLAEAMAVLAARVLEENAGTGYRRMLMRGLASLAIQRLEGGVRA